VLEYCTVSIEFTLKIFG